MKCCKWSFCGRCFYVLKCSLKIITVWTTCVIWKLSRSHAVTPRWLDDAEECIQSGWSKQRDCCSLAQETLAADWSLRSKAALLENYLAVSTWILNGSSIECHEKKHQPFSLSGVRFGSWAIQISVWKSAWRWSGRKCAFLLWLLITCSKSQRKTHQIAQIRHFEPRKFWNKQTV